MKKKNLKIYPSLFLIASLFFLMVYTSSNIKRYLYSDLKPLKIPPEFSSVNADLGKSPGLSKVIWLPPQFDARIMKWTGERKIGDFMTPSSAKPTMTPDTLYSRLYYLFTNKLITKVPYYDHFFDFLNARFIIWRTDSPEVRGPSHQDALHYLKKQPGLEFVSQQGYLNIFRNKGYSDLISIPKQNYLVVGGLEALNTLNSFEEFNVQNTALTFLNQNLEKDIVNNLLKRRNTLIFQDSEPKDLIFNLINNQYFIRPAQFTASNLNRKEWTQASIYEPLHGEWHRIIEGDYDTENWDFDYDAGLVYSQGEKSEITIPLKITQENTYDIYLRYFENRKGGEILFSDDGDKSKIETFSYNDKFVWIKLESRKFSKGEYKLKFSNLFGFNAINLICVIPQEKFKEYVSKTEDALSQSNQLYFKKYVPELSFNPIDFVIFRKEKYHLFIKISPRPGINEIFPRIDDQKLERLPVNQDMDRSSWYSLGKIELDSGLHTFSVPPPEGENKLSPQDFMALDYPGAELELDKNKIIVPDADLQVYIPKDRNTNDRRIITKLLPVEEDTNYYLEFDLKGQDVQEVNARVLFYDKNYNEETNRRAFLAREIMIDKKGTFDFKKNAKNFSAPHDATYCKIEFRSEKNPKQSSYWWLRNIKLYKYSGLSDFEGFALIPENFSFQNDLENMPQINYTKLYPTKYRVEIKGVENPFILAFAESYDPMWRVKEKSEKGYFQSKIDSLLGKEKESVESFPLYSVINGFYIDPQKLKTDELIIEYEPQNWFEMGIWISASSMAISFLTFIIYRVYKKCKGRRDKKYA